MDIDSPTGMELTKRITICQSLSVFKRIRSNVSLRRLDPGEMGCRIDIIDPFAGGKVGLNQVAILVIDIAV